jgi:hypothetical protein
VWADEHRRASITEALGRHDRHRRHLHAVTDDNVEPAATQGRLDLGDGNYDVEVPDLAARYSISDQETGA